MLHQFLQKSNGLPSYAGPMGQVQHLTVKPTGEPGELSPALLEATSFLQYQQKNKPNNKNIDFPTLKKKIYVSKTLTWNSNPIWLAGSGPLQIKPKNDKLKYIKHYSIIYWLTNLNCE